MENTIYLFEVNFKRSVNQRAFGYTKDRRAIAWRAGEDLVQLGLVEQLRVLRLRRLQLDRNLPAVCHMRNLLGWLRLGWLNIA